jgi:hypothetical protein
MSKYLTGNKDLDMEIILNLRDDEIEPVCNVNKYVKDICESEIFWYRRIVKRIEYAKNENFKIEKNLNDIPINGEGINQMKFFLGFKKLKELNDYLNNFLPKALYQIYYDYQNDKNFYEIDEKKLPDYINIEKLIYELRKAFLRGKYQPRNINSNYVIDIDSIRGLKIHTLIMKQDMYTLCKRLEII